MVESTTSAWSLDVMEYNMIGIGYISREIPYLAVVPQSKSVRSPADTN
jgi:hypothetical protein